MGMYACPICGYRGFAENPLDETFDICPCCGIEFGYPDGGLSLKHKRRFYTQARAMWVQTGMPWGWGHFGKPVWPTPPQGWNPRTQLAALQTEGLT